MKQLLKRTLRPLFTTIKNARSRPPRNYHSYEAALEDCGTDAYQSADIVRVVVEKNIRFRESIERLGALDLGALRTLIGIGLAKSGADESLNVIDFGGGGGYHYTIAKAALGKQLKLRWNVVETSAMTREAQRMSNSELKFFDSIESAHQDLGSVDLIFTSGALQYCPDPISILSALVNVRAAQIFITRTALSDDSNRLVIVQNSLLSHNGPGNLPPEYTDRPVSYPAVFVSRQQFESVIKQHYHIRFAISEDRSAYRTASKEIDMFGYFCVLASGVEPRRSDI